VADQGHEGSLSPLLGHIRVAAAVPFLRESVLDIGCGSGRLARYVPATHYLGVDRDEKVLELARTEYPSHRFASYLPGGEVFATVVALAVIEHVEDAKCALSEWTKYLMPAGRLLLTTPHPRGEKIHRLGAVVGLFSRHAADEHTRLLDRQAITAVASAVNLRIVRYQGFLAGFNQLVLLERAHD
jgi:SAM-dependent methyltransferase